MTSTIRLFVGSIVFVASVLLFYVCTDQSPYITYRPYSSLFLEPSDTTKLFIWKQWRILRRPSLAFNKEFLNEWHLQYGGASEVLLADFLSLPCSLQVVDLPHRVLRPNTAMWYYKTIDLSERGVLTIKADDGAQLFINGKQVSRLFDNHFPIDTIGQLQITIRVLNNAMEGGLQSVTFSTHQQLEKYKNAYNQYADLKLLAEKILLMENPLKDFIRVAEQAFTTKNPTDIENATEYLRDYPMLFPYLFRKQDGVFRVNVLTDSHEAVEVSLWQNGKLQTMCITGPVASFDVSVEESNNFMYALTCGLVKTPVYAVDVSKNSDEWTFNVWADSQGGWEKFSSHMNNTLQYDDSFGVGVGDLVANGSDSVQWIDFLKALSISACVRPYYLIAGNHDYDGYYDDLHSVWYSLFVSDSLSTYFSWTYHNAAFIALDPNKDFPIGIKKGTEQYEWFHKEIHSNEWRSADWRFVLVHQPPYSQGWPGYEGDNVIRDLLEPVIESAKIDFVIAGHTHDYERITKTFGQQKTTFLIVGGAGGLLEPPESSLSPEMDTVIKEYHVGRFTVNRNSICFEAVDRPYLLLDSICRNQ